LSVFTWIKLKSPSKNIKISTKLAKNSSKRGLRGKILGNFFTFWGEKSGERVLERF